MKNTIVLMSLIVVTVLGIVACTTKPILPEGFLENITPDDPCPEGTVVFKRDVLPIISSNCAFSGCHDAITAADDIVLDTYENIMKEVTPFDPNDSELYESIVESDPDDIMPPPPYAELSNDQILVIKNWINQGALNIECGGCDTATVTFTNTVYPIVQNQCMTCHNDNRQDGGVNLANHGLIKQSVENGGFMGSILHDPNYSAMPPSGIQLDQCFIDQLQIWINDGMPNN